MITRDGTRFRQYQNSEEQSTPLTVLTNGLLASKPIDGQFST
jgi:hypothetical protein